MVTDAQGQVADALQLPNRASKGLTGGRTISLHRVWKQARLPWQPTRGDVPGAERRSFFTNPGGGLSPATVRLWFPRLYTTLQMDGCSSPPGRRTFITRATRRVSQV